MRTIIQEHTAPARGPTDSSSPRPPALSWAPLHWLRVQSGTCSCGRHPWAAASFRPHLVHCGLLNKLQNEICSVSYPIGCRQIACSNVYLLTGYSERLPQHLECLLSSCTDFIVCRIVFLSFSHSCVLLFWSSFSFLKYALTEAEKISHIVSALASVESLLEPAGIGSYLTWVSWWTLLREITSAAHSLTHALKTLPHQPNILSFTFFKSIGIRMHRIFKGYSAVEWNCMIRKINTPTYFLNHYQGTHLWCWKVTFKPILQIRSEEEWKSVWVSPLITDIHKVFINFYEYFHFQVLFLKFLKSSLNGPN